MLTREGTRPGAGGGGGVAFRISTKGGWGRKLRGVRLRGPAGDELLHVRRVG